MRPSRAKPPRKAVVLAAGFATRLRPLSYSTPKPLLPVWNKPVLGHTLDRLESWGVREVLINLHYRADDVMAYLRNNRWKLRITLSFEPEILGTAGALRAAEWFLDDDAFWMINADILFEFNAAPLIRSHAEHAPIATLWMHDALGPRTVDMGSDGTILSFASRRPRAEGTYTFCGLHLLEPRILDFINETGADSIISAYERAQAKNRLVRGVSIQKSYWRDIGSIPAYLEAHRSTLAGFRQHTPGGAYVSSAVLCTRRRLSRDGVTVCGATSVHPAVTIRSGARLSDAVISAGNRIGPNADLHDCVVDPSSPTVNRSATGFLSGLEIYPPDHPVRACADQLGLDRERCGVECLGTRGSERTIYRLYQSKDSIIVVHFDPTRIENTLFTRAADFLKESGLRVPRILHDVPGRGYYACEDLGTRDLNDSRLSDRNRKRLYTEVLAALERIHHPQALVAAMNTIPLAPPFSPELYAWEHELFIREFLVPFLKADASTVRRVRRVLLAGSKRLADEPAVLLHRDLQSSNIMIHRTQAYLIDFQGMRGGPASYDLASLIYDPYAVLSLPQRVRILEASAAAGSANLSYAAIQRLCQACGAYGRLSQYPGGDRYLQYLEPARRNLRIAIADQAGFDSLQQISRHSWNIPRG
jgi:NDP-sugar pyrophosphorylase family protein/aminoglycoside/choline kinase family phosphotransferase